MGATYFVGPLGHGQVGLFVNLVKERLAQPWYNMATFVVSATRLSKRKKYKAVAVPQSYLVNILPTQLYAKYN